MTKKLRLLLIALCACIAFVCLFAGCSLKPTLGEVLNDLNSNGANVDVTYFANEGSFNGNKKIRNLRFKAGSKAYNIGTHSASKNEVKIVSGDVKYELAGWYEAEINPETGYPVYEDGGDYEFSYDPTSFDSTKNIKHTGELFNFDTALEKGTHYYLVAVWRKVQMVNVVLAGEVESIKVKEGDEEKTYTSGEVIHEIVYESSGEIPQQQDALLSTSKVLDATFVEFYSKSTCNKDELFTGWPIKRDDHKDDEEPFTIYAKYIAGNDWKIVKDISGVSDMFSNAIYSENRYYIVKDIDCNNLKVSARTGPTGFACEIKGNGCTISGIKTELSFTANQRNCGSLFGSIKDTAKISDLKIDVTQEYKVNASANVNDGIYFAFYTIADGAEVEGVELSGTIKVTCGNGSYIRNIQGGSSNHWKFGGYLQYDAESEANVFVSFGSDADYTAGGISVNATLEIE